MPAHTVPTGFPEPPAEFLRAIGADTLARFTAPENEPEAHEVRELERRLDGFSGTLARRARVLEHQAAQVARELSALEAEVRRLGG